MSYLSIRNITVAYGDVKALDQVNLEIEKGEFFSLLGPSGSGKSTLLLCMAGFISPLSGSISIDGRDMNDVPPNKREIGMVFQNYALFPHKSVYENVAYPLQVRGQSKKSISNRVNELLEKLDLANYQRRMPNELSGGQQQRVALARALVFDPSIILLDEPHGSLDKNLRERMQLEIRRLQQESETTVIYVTHDHSEALSVSDRIGIIRDGKIEQVGTPGQLYGVPLNVFVAGFLGPINVLRIRVLSINQTTCSLELTGNHIDNVPRPHWLVRSDMPAMLLVRPEHLRVVRVPAGHAALPCAVRENRHVGQGRHLLCALGDGSLVEVHQSALEGLDIDPGNRAYIEFYSEKFLLFQESAEALQIQANKTERRLVNHG